MHRTASRRRCVGAVCMFAFASSLSLAANWIPGVRARQLQHSMHITAQVNAGNGGAQFTSISAINSALNAPSGRTNVCISAPPRYSCNCCRTAGCKCLPGNQLNCIFSSSCVYRGSSAIYNTHTSTLFFFWLHLSGNNISRISSFLNYLSCVKISISFFMIL